MKYKGQRRNMVRNEVRVIFKGWIMYDHVGHDEKFGFHCGYCVYT